MSRVLFLVKSRSSSANGKWHLFESECKGLSVCGGLEMDSRAENVPVKSFDLEDDVLDDCIGLGSVCKYCRRYVKRFRSEGREFKTGKSVSRLSLLENYRRNNKRVKQ